MDSIMITHEKGTDYITLNDGIYDIELARIPDHEALLHWLKHLLEKNWFTAEVADEFITMVYTIKGWDFYRRNH